MFNFLKKRKDSNPSSDNSEHESQKIDTQIQNSTVDKPSILQRLKAGLQRTRATFSESLANIILR